MLKPPLPPPPPMLCASRPTDCAPVVTIASAVSVTVTPFPVPPPPPNPPTVSAALAAFDRVPAMLKPPLPPPPPIDCAAIPSEPLPFGEDRRRVGDVHGSGRRAGAAEAAEGRGQPEAVVQLAGDAEAAVAAAAADRLRQDPVRLHPAW